MLRKLIFVENIRVSFSIRKYGYEKIAVPEAEIILGTVVPKATSIIAQNP